VRARQTVVRLRAKGPGLKKEKGIFSFRGTKRGHEKCIKPRGKGASDLDFLFSRMNINSRFEVN
jgi:hypothetical protein